MTLSEKVLFYSSLNSLLSAGLTPSRALQTGMPPAIRRLCAGLSNQVEQGVPLSQAISEERCFSPMEIALIRVGECTGSLPSACQQLQQYFEEQKALRGKLRGKLTYPLLVYHFAGLVFALLQHLSGSGNCLISLILWTLAPWVLLLLWKILSPLRNTSAIAAFTNALPFFGHLQFQREVGRFLGCFSCSLTAGMDMQQAILISAEVCQTALYRKHFRQIAQCQNDSGLPFSACSIDHLPRQWPDELLVMLQTGEASGSLPLSAERGAKLLNEGAQKRMHMLAVGIPAIFYALLALHIAMKVIGFGMGYINQINELTQ